MSRGYGAGWSTWGESASALDQEICVAVLNGNWDEAHLIADVKWPDQYKGGLSDCYVEIIDKGTQFKIDEYDGYESIEFSYNTYWSVA